MHEEPTQRMMPPDDYALALAQVMQNLLEPYFARLEMRIASLFAAYWQEEQLFLQQILVELRQANGKSGGLVGQPEKLVRQIQKTAA